MRLLITGGCGFIGANFVRYQRRHHPADSVVVLDALTYTGNLHNLDALQGDAGVKFVRGVFCVFVFFLCFVRDERIDAIAHLAAESHVDRSILGPMAFIQTNVVGTATLLEAARKASIGRFLHVSTDEVYGSLSATDPAFTEDTPLDPRSPYSASKASSDLLVQSYAHTYQFPALITRCSNNYGAYQFPEKLIPLMILNAMQDKPLPVYGDGKNVRDWIHVEDHCAGLDAVLRRGKIDPEHGARVYNLGGRSERTNLEIVHAILKLVGKPASLIRFVTDRPGHDRRYAIECARAEKELGWAPERRLEEGLAETVAWYRDNAAWWQAIQSGEYRAWFERNYGARLDGGDRAAAGGRG